MFIKEYCNSCTERKESEFYPLNFGEDAENDLKKQSAVPTPSFDEPPDKQARRNSAALIVNILWSISKIKYILEE